MSSHLQISIGLIIVAVLLSVAHAFAERKHPLCYAGKYLGVFVVLFMAFYSTSDYEAPSFYIPLIVVVFWLAVLFDWLFAEGDSRPTSVQLLKMAAGTAILGYIYLGAPGFAEICARLPSARLFG